MRFLLSQGLAAERKKRWCAECAKKHPDDTDMVHVYKSCEDCKKKDARYGLAKVRAPDQPRRNVSLQRCPRGTLDLGQPANESCTGLAQIQAFVPRSCAYLSSYIRFLHRLHEILAIYRTCTHTLT